MVPHPLFAQISKGVWILVVIQTHPFPLLVTPPVSARHHHRHHLFLKCPFLPHMRLLHTSLNTTHSEHKPSSSITSFTHSLQVFLPAHHTPATTTFLQADTKSSPLALTFHMPKPPQSTMSHHLSHALKSEPPKDCTNPHCTSYPSAIPRTFISPSSVPSYPDFADLLSSSPRFQSHMSILSGHKPCISFPLCGMMHPELSG